MPNPKRILKNLRNKIFDTLIRLFSKLLRVFGVVTLEEKNLIRLIPFIGKLDHLEGSVSLFGKPFYFDALKIDYHFYLFVIETRINQDCFLFKNITIENPVVLDVGAYIGFFSRFVLGEKKSATVYSLEPDPQTFFFLEKNLASYENAHTFQKGVMDRKGQAELYRTNLWQWGSTINPEFAEKTGEGKDYFNASHQVETTDLDTFVGENNIKHVDLLVLNVPGEIEHLILMGAKDLIKNFRPQVTISVYQKNLDNVTAFFKKVGDYCEIENPYTEPQSKTKIRIFSPSK